MLPAATGSKPAAFVGGPIEFQDRCRGRTGGFPGSDDRTIYQDFKLVEGSDAMGFGTQANRFTRTGQIDYVSRVSTCRGARKDQPVRDHGVPGPHRLNRMLVAQ